MPRGSGCARADSSALSPNPTLMSLITRRAHPDSYHARPEHGQPARQSRDGDPQKALCGGIPGAVLEPLVRFWSHFVGIYRQNLTRSIKN